MLSRCTDAVAVADAVVGVDGATRAGDAGAVGLLEVGGDVTDVGDGAAGATRREPGLVATRRPSRAAPWNPPPHAVPRIAARTAMSARARVLLVTLAYRVRSVMTARPV